MVERPGERDDAVKARAPPVSLPIAANAIPVTTATADPPDEPPGMRVSS